MERLRIPCLPARGAWRWLEPATLDDAERLLDRIGAMLHRLIARAG